MGSEGIQRIWKIIFVVVPYSVLVPTYRYHSTCKMMKALIFSCIKQNSTVWTTELIIKLICLNDRLATDSVHHQEWIQWTGFKGNKGHVQLQLKLTQ